MLPAFGLQVFDSIVAGDDLPTKTGPDMVHKALAVQAELRMKPVSLVIAKQTWEQPRRRESPQPGQFWIRWRFKCLSLRANRVIQNLMELIVNDT